MHTDTLISRTFVYAIFFQTRVYLIKEACQCFFLLQKTEADNEFLHPQEFAGREAVFWQLLPPTVFPQTVNSTTLVGISGK